MVIYINVLYYIKILVSLFGAISCIRGNFKDIRLFNLLAFYYFKHVKNLH